MKRQLKIESKVLSSFPRVYMLKMDAFIYRQLWMKRAFISENVTEQACSVYIGEISNSFVFWKFMSRAESAYQIKEGKNKLD